MRLHMPVGTRPIIAGGPLGPAGREPDWASIALTLQQHDETLMTSARADRILILDP
jgi:hypothetical protein